MTQGDHRDDRARELADQAKNVLHTAIGAGVLGFQKLQVGRNELQRFLSSSARSGPSAADLRHTTRQRARELDNALRHTLGVVDSALEPIAARLPAPARQLLTTARGAANGLHDRVSRLLAEPDAAPRQVPSDPPAEEGGDAD